MSLPGGFRWKAILDAAITREATAAAEGQCLVKSASQVGIGKGPGLAARHGGDSQGGLRPHLERAVKSLDWSTALWRESTWFKSRREHPHVGLIPWPTSAARCRRAPPVVTWMKWPPCNLVEIIGDVALAQPGFNIPVPFRLRFGRESR